MTPSLGLHTTMSSHVVLACTSELYLYEVPLGRALGGNAKILFGICQLGEDVPLSPSCHPLSTLSCQCTQEKWHLWFCVPLCSACASHPPCRGYWWRIVPAWDNWSTLSTNVHKNIVSQARHHTLSHSIYHLPPVSAMAKATDLIKNSFKGL